jgi:hypothetical protein
MEKKLTESKESKSKSAKIVWRDPFLLRQLFVKCKAYEEVYLRSANSINRRNRVLTALCVVLPLFLNVPNLNSKAWVLAVYTILLSALFAIMPMLSSPTPFVSVADHIATLAQNIESELLLELHDYVYRKYYSSMTRQLKMILHSSDAPIPKNYEQKHIDRQMQRILNEQKQLEKLRTFPFNIVSTQQPHLPSLPPTQTLESVSVIAVPAADSSDSIVNV